ncbi:MAG TPA: hypothetical protein VLE73_04480 [Candidatus Saccharimonadales bacterium]|nr:hypothetical protein [Candidatus Saccharimonadales bacterium]
MPELSPDIITFKRPLVWPEPQVIGELQANLIGVVGQYMPIDKNSVRFSHPAKCAISIVGGNAIAYAMRTAHPDSELVHLTYDQIADAIEEEISATPMYADPTTISVLAHKLQGRKPDRKMYGTQLAESSILEERHLGKAALTALGGVLTPPPYSRRHALRWIKFLTQCPKSLEEDLIKVTNEHIPPNSQLIFDPVKRIRQGSEQDKYLRL